MSRAVSSHTRCRTHRRWWEAVYRRADAGAPVRVAVQWVQAAAVGARAPAAANVAAGPWSWRPAGSSWVQAGSALSRCSGGIRARPAKWERAAALKYTSPSGIREDIERRLPGTKNSPIKLAAVAWKR